VADALPDERHELPLGDKPAARLFTIPDVSKRGRVYAPKRRLGQRHQISITTGGGLGGMLLRVAAFIAATIATAAIGLASLAHSEPPST
jgi:hypothetical protein